MATLDTATDKATSVTYHWPAQGAWTYDDYARLPDDGWRYEIIGGELLVIEVLSPATARHDRTTKYHLYAEAGVTEYWIIDPEAGAADIYTRRGNGFVPLGHYERGGIIQSELLPELRLPLDELLADA